MQNDLDVLTCRGHCGLLKHVQHAFIQSLNLCAFICRWDIKLSANTIQLPLLPSDTLLTESEGWDCAQKTGPRLRRCRVILAPLQTGSATSGETDWQLFKSTQNPTEISEEVTHVQILRKLKYSPVFTESNDNNWNYFMMNS